MLFKNTASQSIALFAFDTTNGAPVTGDASNMVFYITKDWGSVTAVAANSGAPTEMDSTNAKGWYKIAISQTESNADAIVLTGKSSTGNVSLVGQTFYTNPPNFGAASIDSSGNVGISSNIKKNSARVGFMFVMTDSTTHIPTAGYSITSTRSIDGGSFSSTTNVASGVGSGVYVIDLSAADMNGNHIMLRFVATGADDLNIEIITQP